jgi:nucleotide-binding universal stress UspA family protein
MYNKIIVPLDGSQLAECVLPHVEALAKGCHAKEVLFVRAVEPYIQPAVTAEFVMKPQDIAAIDARMKAEAEAYMKKLVDSHRYEGVKSGWKVIMGKAAESLVDLGKQDSADLFVIATHGRSGASRWVYGSVADRILRSACIPVLMVRAPGCYPGI